MIKSSITRSITVLFMLIASVALISADWLVSAQNSNSSTTQDEQTRGGMMTSQNTNMSSTGGHRRRSRRRRSKAASTGDMTGDTGNANMAGDTSTPSGDMQNANMTGDTGNANMAVSTGGKHRRRRGRRGNAGMASDTTGAMQTTGRRCEIDPGTQTDLGGQSYTGKAEYADGGVNGTATLEFQSGNQFSLTPEGGSAVSGRYSAVTSCGYIGVTMMFTGTPATIVSVRLKKVGNGVWIKSVPGENHQFSFTSSGGGGRMGGRMGGKKHRGKRGRRGGTRISIKPPMASPEATPTP